MCRSLIILPSDFPVSPGKGIRLAEEVGENGTWELLDSTLKDEDAHIDWLESQLDQINQMAIRGGCPWYLARAKALYMGPSNTYLKSRGLPSLIEEDYVTDRAAVYRPVRTVVWRRPAAAQCRSSPHVGSVR